MRESRINRLVVMVAFAAIACVLAADAGEKAQFPVLKERATAEGATPEGRAYLSTLSKSMEGAFGSAMQRCEAALRSKPLPSVELVLTLGADGRPKEVAVSPETDGTRWVAESFQSATFRKPPREPFLVYLNLNLAGK